MKSKTILLVEDNPDDIELTLRSLKKHNISNELIVKRDGQEALDYLFSEGAYAGGSANPLPTLILLDIKLPKLSGLEVVKRIRADGRTRTLPVVILTSSNEERDVIDGYNNGCNSYIRKPIDFTEFSDAIGKLGIYWLLVNEPPVTK